MDQPELTALKSPYKLVLSLDTDFRSMNLRYGSQGLSCWSRFYKVLIEAKNIFCMFPFFYKNLILFSQKRVKAYKLRASGADRQYEAPFPGFTELLFPNSRSTLLCTRFYQWWRAILSPTKRTELFRKACQVSLAY